MFDSSGELTIRAECSRGVDTEPFASQFEVFGGTSEDEVRRRASRKGGLRNNLKCWFSSHILYLLLLPVPVLI